MVGLISREQTERQDNGSSGAAKTDCLLLQWAMNVGIPFRTPEAWLMQYLYFTFVRLIFVIRNSSWVKRLILTGYCKDLMPLS